MSTSIRKTAAAVLALAILLAGVAPAWAETTLEKIDRPGAPGEPGLLGRLLRDRGPVPGQEGEPDQGRPRHRGQADRGPAGVDEREGGAGEVPAGPAGRLPGPAGRVHRARPGEDRRLHQRRGAGRRAEGQGPEPRRR